SPHQQALGRGLLLSLPDRQLSRLPGGADRPKENLPDAKVGPGSAATSVAAPHDSARSGGPQMRPLLLAILLLVAGCGYSQSGGENNKQQGGYHWNSLYREDIQTVSIPIFTTKDYRRGIEFRLTEAVIKQLELRCPGDSPWS